jgi:chemotaxis regulatin CheY-phosphate phosphatase CheZ
VHVAEVAPAAVPLAEVAVGLFAFAAFLACAGLNHVWGATAGWSLRFLADQLDSLEIHVRWIGRVRPLGPIAAAFRWVDHETQRLLGIAALNSQHAATYLFGEAAKQVKWIGREILALSHLQFTGIHTLLHTTLPRLEHRALLRARSIAHGVEHRVTVNIGSLRRELRIGVKGLQRAVIRADHAAARALDWSEGAFGRAEKTARAQAKRLSALERFALSAAFAAAVAVALRRLGMKWLRCSNTKKAAKSLCGMDVNLLESLLLDATAIVGTISVIEMAKELQSIEGEAVKLMRGFVRELP